MDSSKIPYKVSFYHIIKGRWWVDSSFVNGFFFVEAVNLCKCRTLTYLYRCTQIICLFFGMCTWSLNLIITYNSTLQCLHIFKVFIQNIFLASTATWALVLNIYFYVNLMPEVFLLDSLSAFINTWSSPRYRFSWICFK